MCTPAAANLDLLRACARRGVRAAFLTSAGYGEAGDDGPSAERELVALCDELGILLAGPNGQGVVSTPGSLVRADRRARSRRPGRIAIASQSGNFVSSFENWAAQTGVGVSRAVSAGNAAAVGIADYLDWYARDAETAVGLAYVEGVTDGRALLRATGSTVTANKPVVLVKGGTTAGGQRAAASHTGSLASDERVFAGMCRQAGVTRATTIEEAFEAAATFATQPLPEGPRTAVMTTAGGWGVVTADAIVRDGDLELATLPDDLLAAIDEHLPPRWSRNNPIDLAGGETRDTIPIVLELVARHPAIDAIVYLGLGIQSNQAQLLRRAASIPTTASSASSPTTSARTHASRRPRPTSPTRPASRSSPRPSSRSRRPTTPGRRPFARPAAFVTRPRTARSPRWDTYGVRPLPPDPRSRVARGRRARDDRGPRARGAPSGRGCRVRRTRRARRYRAGRGDHDGRGRHRGRSRRLAGRPAGFRRCSDRRRGREPAAAAGGRDRARPFRRLRRGRQRTSTPLVRINPDHAARGGVDAETSRRGGRVRRCSGRTHRFETRAVS